MELAKKRRLRGEVTKDDIIPFLLLSIDKLLFQISSNSPTNRTCAATALGNHREPEVVTALCNQLEIEEKLYCRIAICESLVKLNPLSIQPLLELLGKIGKNQETKIPKKGFNKISYPLPRDIAARALCRMGSNILPELFEFMEQIDQPLVLEQTIDVIGHIVYTEKLDISSKELIEIADKYRKFEMVLFKITRCFSGFKDDSAKQFLHNQLRSKEIGFQLEAARSLFLSENDLHVNFPLPIDVETFIKALRKKTHRGL